MAEREMKCLKKSDRARQQGCLQVSSSLVISSVLANSLPVYLVLAHWLVFAIHFRSVVRGKISKTLCRIAFTDQTNG